MRYRRPSRMRRVAKWVGIGLVVITAVAWTSSMRWHGNWAVSNNLVVSIIGGCICVGDKAPRHGQLHFMRLKFGYSQRVRIGLHMPFWWFPRKPDQHYLVVYVGSTRGGKWGVVIPFWIPFLLFVFPTAILWHRDRRTAKPGNCQLCGYNLTGNESGVCPECATPIVTE